MNLLVLNYQNKTQKQNEDIDISICEIPLTLK
jgi:hypothetical protein